MKRVLIGNLAAPSRIASSAISRGTPSISNMIRPGFTRAAQNSTAPLPDPMRTSVGFLVTGTSGKMRIHTLPARFMWRVMARRAASIWRAVTRSGSIALRPKAPKLSSVPPLAAPLMRPLNCLRNFVRFGCSMSMIQPFSYFLRDERLARLTPWPAAAFLLLGQPLVLGHSGVLEDLALEDPHLDADRAIGGHGGGRAVIDVGTQRVQRHPAFAIPLDPGDLRPAEPPGAGDADALGTHAQRRLHRPLHGATESHPALQLLGDVLRHQRRFGLGLAHLDDVEMHLRVGHL